MLECMQPGTAPAQQQPSVWQPPSCREQVLRLLPSKVCCLCTSLEDGLKGGMHDKRLTLT